MYLDGGFYLLLVLFFDTYPELAITIDQILLIDSNGQLFRQAVVDEAFPFGVLVGEDYFAVQTVLVGYDLVGLAFVESEFRFALSAFFGGAQLLLGLVGLRHGLAF